MVYVSYLEEAHVRTASLSHVTGYLLVINEESNYIKTGKLNIH